MGALLGFSIENVSCIGRKGSRCVGAFRNNLPVQNRIFLPALHQIKHQKSIGFSARHASSIQHQDTKI